VSWGVGTHSCHPQTATVSNATNTTIASHSAVNRRSLIMRHLPLADRRQADIFGATVGI